MEGSLPPPEKNIFIMESLLDFLYEADFETELSPELAIREEMIEEVMQDLYKEISCTEERAVTPSLLPPQPAPAVIEVGKSESCGASMSESESESSIMAGVTFGEVKEDEFMDGCDGVEFGDEWLEKVMGWNPLELELWTQTICMK